MYPRVALNIFEAPSKTITAQLENREADAIIVPQMTSVHQSWVQRPICLDPFFIYDNVKSGDLDKLSGEQIWLLEDGYCFRKQVVSLLRSEDIQPYPSVSFKGGGFETLVRLIKMNKGYTFIPNLMLLDSDDFIKPEYVHPITPRQPACVLTVTFSKNHFRKDLIRALHKMIVECIPMEIAKLNEEDFHLVYP